MAAIRHVLHKFQCPTPALIKSNTDCAVELLILIGEKALTSSENVI